MVKDMTVGRPTPLIVSFFLPLFASSLFQQLYNTIDMMIVGQFIGKGALAAVSATGTLTFLILGLIQGLCAGFCIPVSRRFGSGDEVGMRRTTAASVFLGAVIALFMTALTVAGCASFLGWMDTPADIFNEAYDYVIIVLWGIPATIFYNISAGLLRAVGNSRTPLVCLIVSSLTNIALDLLLILAFDMGVQGAALATVLAQILSGILCLAHILRRLPILHPHGEEWRPSGKTCRELLAFGLPMGFQTALAGLGAVISQTAVNVLGTDYVAAVGATVKIQHLVMQPMESLGIAMVTYTAQNLGADKLDRIHIGVRRAAVIMAGLVAAAFAVVFFGSPYLLLLFLKPEETAVIAAAVRYLRANCSLYFVLGALYLFRNTLQGLGYTLPAMLSGMMQMLMHLIVARCLAPSLGFAILCFDNPLAWIAATLLLIVSFFIAMHRLARRAQAAPAHG